MKRSRATPYFARRKTGPPGSFRRLAGPHPAPAATQAADAPPANEADESIHDEGPAPSLLRNPRIWIPAAGVVAAAVPIALRLMGVIAWPWVAVLSPFTVAGLAVAVIMAWFLGRQEWAAVRAGGAGATPAPEVLEAPRADGDSSHILIQHPELLAALCHGFRMRRLMPAVLGHSVTDPWGVYTAALSASSIALEQLHTLATVHTARAVRAAARGGHRPSDGQAMRMALDAFHKCAARAETGRGHPDCPFEHVTVMYGVQSPNRDANLRSVAPKVRALLERQYPQLKTARLSDGSAVTFGDWRAAAADDRAALARLRKDLERHERTIGELQTQLKTEQRHTAALRDAAETQRRTAIEDARADQAQVVADLRAAIERADRDHAREMQRRDAELARQATMQTAMAAERDALERALLATAESSDETNPAPTGDLSGKRILLVGGETRQIAPLRTRLEELGAQLLHDDGIAAAEHAGTVHAVVFWIRYLSHPTYFGVRQKVRVARTPHGYWTRTSPDSLVATIGEILMDDGHGTN